MGGMECYEQDFEESLLVDTGNYYKVKAAAWIEQDSCPDYMQKADECLQKEEERVENYLHSSTKVGGLCAFLASPSESASASVCSYEVGAATSVPAGKGPERMDLISWARKQCCEQSHRELVGKIVGKGN
jgi:hypothetical protein